MNTYKGQKVMLQKAELRDLTDFWPSFFIERLQ